MSPDYNDSGFTGIELDEARVIINTDTESFAIGRRNLRGKNIFTLTKSISDTTDTAYSIKKTNEGFTCSLHIADTAHYIINDSAMDKAARERGKNITNSIVNIPMVPYAIKAGVCNLNEKSGKLTVTVEAKFDCDGTPLSCNFYESFTEVKFNAVFSEIDVIYTNADDSALFPLRSHYTGIKEEIANMYELAGLLRQRRLENNEPVIEAYETQITFNENKISIETSPYPDSMMMAEEISEAVRRMAASKFISDGSGAVFAYRKEPWYSPYYISAMPFISYSNCIDSFTSFIINSPMHRELSILASKALAYPRFSSEPVVCKYANTVSLPVISPTMTYSGLTILRAIKSLINGINFDPSKALDVLNGKETQAFEYEKKLQQKLEQDYLKANVQKAFAGRVTAVTEEGSYIMLEKGILGFLPNQKLQESQAITIFYDKTSNDKILFKI